MGILYVIGTPIGNLGDMTPRSIEILNMVDLIACEDTRMTIKLLNVFKIKTKMISYHKFNEYNRSKELINKLKEGLNIALVSDAGTPCISDPGYILIKEAKEQNIEVIGIPGSSALITALSVSGINTDKFIFYGFLDTDNSKFKKEIEKIQENPINTIVIYESPKRLVKTVKKLAEYFPSSIISISSDLTKKFERNFYGKIEEVYEIISQDKKIDKGEYVIVLEKETIINNQELNISIEALILDLILKNKYSLKEAINDVCLIYNLKKNEVKEASLKLKEFDFFSLNK